MDIIGERTVDFVETATGQTSTVRSSIGRPTHNGANWTAPVAIYGPAEETWEAESHGGTSLQALFHALALLTTFTPRRFSGRRREPTTWLEVRSAAVTSAKSSQGRSSRREHLVRLSWVAPSLRKVAEVLAET